MQRYAEIVDLRIVDEDGVLSSAIEEVLQKERELPASRQLAMVLMARLASAAAAWSHSEVHTALQDVSRCWQLVPVV